MPPSSWRVTAGALFDPEKTPVTSAGGVVAANHPIGSAAGLEMLAIGGSALNPAVSTFNVVEPMQEGDRWNNVRMGPIWTSR